jgi:hypothetical protein
MPEEAAPAPLALPVLNPRSLEDIFNTTPLEMSDEELDLFIAHCREVRQKVLEAEVKGKPRVGAKEPKAAAKAVPAPVAPPNSQLSIDDLL